MTTATTTKYYCLICHCKFTEQDIENHLHSKKHYKNLDRCHNIIRNNERLIYNYYNNRNFEKVTEYHEQNDEYIKDMENPIVKN